MKAITICEPFATLIARGVKRVENRRWPTAYHGPLAIHAGKSRSWLMLSESGRRDPRYDILLSEMAFGCVVAVVQVMGCERIHTIRDGLLDWKFPWLRDHEHTEGPFCWILENVVRLPEPIPARGAQGLWEWDAPASVLELLETAR